MVHPTQKFRKRIAKSNPDVKHIKSVPAPNKQVVHPVQKIRKRICKKKIVVEQPHRRKKKTPKIDDVVEVTSVRTQHPSERKKLREKRLARGNSASVNALFRIDTEDYVDKALVFDLKTTGEEEIFD